MVPKHLLDDHTDPDPGLASDREPVTGLRVPLLWIRFNESWIRIKQMQNRNTGISYTRHYTT